MQLTTGSLYPFKFKTIFKDKIWGGNKIHTLLGKDFSPFPNCGETWEISGVPGNLSIVSNGILNGKTLVELIHQYKEELLGRKVYEQFGDEFPLLIKFIDANDDLSIQVHPNDALAKERHNSFGKTEMWYILQADPGAKLNTGFNQPLDEETYLAHLGKNTLEEILNFEEVKAGDVFFLPSGRVHYIGKGICLAEIQQTSDITYRIYDFDRKDDKGNKRELHTDLALAAIDYQFHQKYKTSYTANENQPSTLVTSPYFVTNLILLKDKLTLNYKDKDTFIIYIVVEGALQLEYNNERVECKMGECILLPAAIKHISLVPDQFAKVLEVYIP